MNKPFKHFKPRPKVKPTAEIADAVRVIEGNLHSAIHKAQVMERYYPGILTRVNPQLWAQLRAILPAVVPVKITNKFEYNLASSIAHTIHAELTAKYGIVQQRWPQTDKHVSAYFELVDMLVDWLEKNPHKGETYAAA